MTRILVAALALAALAAVFALAWRRLFSQPAAKKGRARARADKAPGAAQDGPVSAGGLLPLSRVEEGMIVRPDGAIVTAVKVESVNASLFTKEELVAESARNAAVLATLKQAFAIVQVHRSPDNTAQRARWSRALADVDARLAYLLKSGDRGYEARKERAYLEFRRAAIRRYMADDERAEASRQATETESFLCVRCDPRPRKDTAEAARAATASLLKHLSDHGFDAHRLGDEELVWLLKTYFDEAPAARASLDPRGQIPLPDFALRGGRGGTAQKEDEGKDAA